MTALWRIMTVLFILVIWGGLVGTVNMLSNSTDGESGELGTAPGTHDEALAAVRVS